MKRANIIKEFWPWSRSGPGFNKKTDVALANLVYNQLRTSAIINYRHILRMIANPG